MQRTAMERKRRQLIPVERPICISLGLYKLLHLDYIGITETTEYFPISVPHYPYRKRFIAVDRTDTALFMLLEESNPCDACMMPGSRPFDVHATLDADFMIFHRPLRCQSGIRGCFLSCLAQELEVEIPPGQTVGFVYEQRDLWDTSFTICDRAEKPVFKIMGDCMCPRCFLEDTWFEVITLNDVRIGTIGVTFHQLHYRFLFVTFPRDLDVHLKGCLIGCGILMRYMFFYTEPLCGKCQCFQMRRRRRRIADNRIPRPPGPMRRYAPRQDDSPDRGIPQPSSLTSNTSQQPESNLQSSIQLTEADSTYIGRSTLLNK
ncbi:phospholipid scramblase 3-like [Ornithodoros turicata]|uniref:phospholipid scramblase 3-like n=1 Tax=Ornithodoros turicata TaxID=34597 RepID=UPI00313885E4